MVSLHQNHQKYNIHIYDGSVRKGRIHSSRSVSGFGDHLTDSKIKMNTDSYVTQHGVIVIPRVADIVKSVTDAVVTSEDTGLNCESMVTQALCRLDGGGEYFKKHCSDLYRKHPKLKFGDVFYTSMNKHRCFPFKYILHAVLGPYDEQRHNEWVESLSDLYTNIFAQADELQIKSIALSFLGTGSNGADLHDAVTVAINAIDDYKPQQLEIVQFLCLDNEPIKRAKRHCENHLRSADRISPVTDEKKRLSGHNGGHGTGDDGRKNKMHDAGNLKMKSVQGSDSNEHEDTARRARDKSMTDPYADGACAELNEQSQHSHSQSCETESQDHETKSDRVRNTSGSHMSEDDSSTTGKSHRNEVKSTKSENSAVLSTVSDSVRVSDDHGDESDHETPKPDSKIRDQPHQLSESDDQSKDSNLNKELVGQREKLVDQHKESVDQNEEQDNQSEESDDQNESCSDSDAETENQSQSKGSDRVSNARVDHISEDDNSTTGKSHMDEVRSIKSQNSEVVSTASDSVKTSDDHGDESDHETPKSDSQINAKRRQLSESDDQSRELVDQPEELVDQKVQQDNQSEESDDENEGSTDSYKETEDQSHVHNGQTEGDHVTNGKEAEDQEDDSDNQIQDTGDQKEDQGSPEVSLENKDLNDKDSLPQAEGSTKTTAKEEEVCPICMDPITDVKKLDKCGHKFCRECIDDSFKHFKPVCPSCQTVYGVLTGNMPKGTMEVRSEPFPSLPGYEGCGVIIIDYNFPDGRQTKKHPHPGKGYRGTSRTAYLPNNKEGQTVLDLLMLAFNRQLTFTVGQSVTTGRDDVVIWNDIHHKTNTSGGSTGYGYPDETYLSRVKEELASKGVTEDQLPGNRGHHTK